MQGNVALLGHEGDGGMVFGHILSYKADAALQLDFLRALAPKLETWDMTGDLAAPPQALPFSNQGAGR